MDTIRIYLENMFARLPGTPEIMKLQKDMLHTMEDKYEELKSEGKSENEAIGIVISEFGNIDELLEELGLKAAQNTEREAGANAGGGWQQSEASSYTHEKEDYDTGAVFLSGEQVEQVISDTRRYSRLTGAGTSLCIMGPALMILINGLFSSVRPELARLSRLEAVFTLFPLFLCLAAGLGMLIYGSSRLEQYKFLKHSNLILSPSLQASVADMQANFQPQCAVITTVGIVLCVLAPFTLIALSQLGESISLGEEYGGTIGIFFLFLFISIAVYLFVTAGSEEDIYKILLQEKKKEGKKKKKASVSSSQAGQTISLILSVYWPLITCIYFIWSFLFHSWSTSWLIWPLASVVRHLLYSVLDTIEKEQKKAKKSKKA